ncbi:MAG: saccharopine dehydrogenase NADP-binding domain-containing protein [Clostridia bacterium]|nr:saccharopine dehydrogenase NADP-binding domain-containing protein [Clostridia bacterium]
MKKILILGTGAQGSTVAQRMDEEANVSEIICADYDKKAVDELVKILKKGKGVQVDANKIDDIVEVAQGVDLIVNALPVQFGINVMEAALKAETNYQDFAATDIEGSSEPWPELMRHLLKGEMNHRFKEIGKTALICTGSAPGVICVAARNAMRYLDSCDSIYMYVYEGVKAKRFLPFWWSPETAFQDMYDVPYCFTNGKITETESFGLPVMKKFKGIDETIRLVEHAHEEPVQMGINAEEFFLGAKEIFFKYGGSGVETAELLHKMGMLSKEPIDINGTTIVPLDITLAMTPPAPKYESEIQEILDEGLESDTGAMLIEAVGMKDGKKVMVETYVNSLGCVEAFEKSKLTGEMYFTGQGGALFTKMFVDDQFSQSGLISSDMLTFEQVDYYLDIASKLDITLDVDVKEL